LSSILHTESAVANEVFVDIAVGAPAPTPEGPLRDECFVLERRAAGRRRYPPDVNGIRAVAVQPEVVTALPTGQTVYRVRLTAVPSPIWRAAFSRPPIPLVNPRYTPEHMEVHANVIIFRTDPGKLNDCLRWIDAWIAYANSIVEE
jgi:hypothetical protein